MYTTGAGSIHHCSPDIGLSLGALDPCIPQELAARSPLQYNLSLSQGAPESIEFLIEDSSQPLRAGISQGRGKITIAYLRSVLLRARLSPSSSWSIVVIAHPWEHALSIEYGMLSSSLAERRTHCPGIVYNT